MMEANKNQSCNKAVLRMELTLSTLTEKPGEPASVYVSFYYYWLNKECLLPDVSKDAGKRIDSVAIMYVCMCMWLVNFRKCFWGQELKGDNNELFSFLFPEF